MKWCQWRALIWHWGPEKYYAYCQYTSVLTLGLMVEFWSTVGIRVDHSLLWPDRFLLFFMVAKKWPGYMRLHVDIIVTLNSVISVILLLCFSLCYHPPPCIYMLAHAILIYGHEKSSKNGENQPLSMPDYFPVHYPTRHLLRRLGL